MSRRICNVEHVPGGAFRCWREPGHAGAHAYGTTNAAEPVPPGRCGEPSPDGVPCVIPKFGHDRQWGFLHSWQQCTGLLVMGSPKTRCRLRPDHEGSHTLTWDRLGTHEGIEL